MIRTILAASLTIASSAAFAVNPLPTGALVRVGADLHYYGDCASLSRARD